MEILEEVWTNIPGFPTYSVSNLGDVMNNKTEKLVKPHLTPHGVQYIPLHKKGANYTRSVKVLVARAYLEGQTKKFSTPINKDGNKSNNRVDNLAWRPLWFANKYSRQFLLPFDHEEDGPVVERATQEEYATIREAAIENGLLFRDVYRSIFSEQPVFPTKQVFMIPHSIQVR